MRRQSMCAAIVATAALAAAQSLPFRNYDVAEGLANSRVNCIYQDRRGYLWIGTWEGLSRFDGAEFVSYDTRDGLGNAYVTSIAEDQDGRLWIATADGTVALFSEAPRRGEASFRRFALPLADHTDYGRCLLGDDDGGLWCGTSQGLFRGELDARGDCTFEERVPGASVLWPQAALALPGGRSVFATRTEVLAIDGASVTRIPHPPGDLGEPTALAPGENGAVLVAFDRGLFELSGSEWSRIPLSLSSNQPLRALLRDRGGDLWIGTWFGLLRKTRDGTTTLARENGLGDDSIRALHEDADGNVWIGTWSGGLSRLATKSIVSWTTENGLADRTTLFLTEDAAGRIVVVMRASIAVIDDGRVRAVAGSDDAQWTGISKPLLQDARGDWWIGAESGLHLAPGPDIDLARARRIGAEHGFPDGGIFGALLESPPGRIWAATAPGELVWVTRGEGDALRAERAAMDLAPLQRFPPRWMVELASGDVWFFPFRGIARSRSGGALEPWTFEPNAAPPDTRCGHEDAHGNLWIGTRHDGLWRTRDPHATPPRFERFERDALASHAVFSIAEDDRGRLYLGTGRGVDRLDPATRAIEHIGTREGLAGEIITHCLTDRRGRIWVAASGGVSRIDPTVVEPETAPPPIWITSVRVGGEELALDPRGVRGVDAGEHPSSANDVEIRFTSPCFRGALAYRYRLGGVDERWSDASAQRSVHYAHLDAGSYRFQVRALHATGAASPWDAEVRFTIRPPFWRSAWFLAACGASAAAAAWAVHRARVRRLLALEKIRTQIATDIHDEMGAGLAQIAILSEVAKRDALDGARVHLDTVAGLARTLRDSMSDIVWSIDPRRDRFADLVQRMRHVASNLFESGGLRVEFDAPSEAEMERLEIAPDRRRHLLLVLKEALSNVARHAHATRVRVAIRREASALVLTIEDDGRGFERASARGGHGLDGLERRARALGGALAIDSTVGRGTRIELVVPI